jgi:hypothetical protein
MTNEYSIRPKASVILTFRHHVLSFVLLKFELFSKVISSHHLTPPKVKRQSDILIDETKLSSKNQFMHDGDPTWESIEPYHHIGAMLS